MTLDERIKKMFEYDMAGDRLWEKGLACDHRRRYGDGDHFKALANTVYAKSNDLFHSASLTERNQIRMRGK